jgi:hypothetical protein
MHNYAVQATEEGKMKAKRKEMENERQNIKNRKS